MGGGGVLGLGEKAAGWLPAPGWAGPPPPGGGVGSALRKALVASFLSKLLCCFLGNSCAQAASPPAGTLVRVEEFVSCWRAREYASRSSWTEAPGHPGGGALVLVGSRWRRDFENISKGGVRFSAWEEVSDPNLMVRGKGPVPNWDRKPKYKLKNLIHIMHIVHYGMYV